MNKALHLSWPGRFDASGQPPRLPEPSQTWLCRERWGREPDTGQLVLGDNLAVLASWRQSVPASATLIYADPPFASGRDYFFQSNDGTNSVAFQDRLSLAQHLNLLELRLRSLYPLLAARGSLLLHGDDRSSHALRFVLDDVLGAKNFINELIWSYRTGGAARKIGFSRKHDTILYYAKDRAQAVWNPPKDKSYLSHKYGFKNIEIFEDEGGHYTLVNSRDVLDFDGLRGNQGERVRFPTQKPLALLEKLLSATSNPGDLVIDPYCGSGTTAVAAAKLGRRWKSIDAAPWAIHTAARRLIQGGHSFSIWSAESNPWSAAPEGFRLEREAPGLYKLAGPLQELEGWALGFGEAPFVGQAWSDDARASLRVEPSPDQDPSTLRAILVARDGQRSISSCEGAEKIA